MRQLIFGVRPRWQEAGFPATRSKDFNGKALILDADGDTQIVSDNDDVVDFDVGGTASVLQIDNTTPDINNSNLKVNGEDVFPGPVLATVQTATGTALDFTGIPAWVKRITITFNRVSGNGTSAFLVQIGDAGGLELTAYASSAGRLTTTPTYTSATSTIGFLLFAAAAAGNLWNGTMILSLHSSSNIWFAMSQGVYEGLDQQDFGTGRKSLSATLDRVRITTVNGTDAFDNGSVNIMYE